MTYKKGATFQLLTYFEKGDDLDSYNLCPPNDVLNKVTKKQGVGCLQPSCALPLHKNSSTSYGQWKIQNKASSVSPKAVFL